MLSYDFFLNLAIILFAAKLFGVIARKLKLPQVVGVLIAGLVIGPNVLGIVSNSDFLSKMAELGVIMIMFTAGLETDLKELKETGPAALLIASMGVLVPLIGGFVLYSAYIGHLPTYATEEFYRAAFIGIIITATSVSITVETLRELGKLKGKVGTAILSAAIIDDIIGIILLSVAVGFKKANVNPLTVIFNTIAFFALCGVVGFVAYRLFKYLDIKYPHKRRIPIYGFAFCLLMAYVAEHFFGIADITGAYISGIILCNIRSSEYIAQKLDINSYMIFSPIFFASIGLKTDITSVNSSVIIFCISFVLVALISKALGCFIAAKLLKFNVFDSVIVGVGMMARGEVALIISQKGLNLGLFDEKLFAAVIFLVIVSSIVTPITMKAIYGLKDKQVNSD